MIGILTGAASAAALGAGVVAYGTFAPRSRLFGPVISRGPDRRRPIVALTFDDGPKPTDTPRVLEVLRRHDVPATFFMIGQMVESYPALCNEAHQQGHLIANHSFDHPRDGPFRGTTYWTRQLTQTNYAIERAIGKHPVLFRPPVGLKTPKIMAAAKRNGMRVVTWTRRGLDGVSTTPGKITGRLTTRMAPGDILALHAGPEPTIPRDGSATVEALPRIIETARAKGLKFVRLDELLALPGYA